MYPSHWPVYVVLDSERTGVGGLSLLVLRISVTVGVAIVSYLIIEQPVRRGAGSARTWRVVAPVAAIGLVVLVFAATISAAPRRTAAATRTDDLATAVRRATVRPDAERVMIVGNSVGWFLGPSFQDLRPTPPISVLNLAAWGCVVPHGFREVRFNLNGEVPTHDVPSCDGAWKGAVDRFKPNIVFWIVSEPPDGDLRYGAKWIHPCTPVYDKLYRRDLREAADVLAGRGATVVFTSAAPSLTAAASREERRHTVCDNRLRRQVARATGSGFVDLMAFVCPHGTCPREINGVVLRPDGQHYEGEGGRLVAGYLLHQAREERKRS